MKKHRTEKQIRKDNDTRVRRAQQWIARARAALDVHARFVFFWIAFDAMIAGGARGVSGRNMGVFFRRVAALDDKGTLPDGLKECAPDIRRLIRLRFTMPTFWENKRPNGDSGESPRIVRASLGMGNSRTLAKTAGEWEEEFTAARNAGKNALHRAISGRRQDDVVRALRALFERLYVVRNQIFHGGSSRRESIGKEQVESGAKVLAVLVPLFADIVESRMGEDWGATPFPRQNNDASPPWLAGE